MAEVLCQVQSGTTGLPNGSAEAKERFYNAMVMRRGFELFWGEVEKQAAQVQREPAFVQQLMAAMTEGPRETTVETDTRML